jgi:hypothetical protein
MAFRLCGGQVSAFKDRSLCDLHPLAGIREHREGR